MADAGRYGLRYRRQEGQKREEEEGACMGENSRVEFSARVLQGYKRAANG